MWYGEYKHNLDEKDRFVLPAKFRARIKKEGIKKFYITRGLDNCLFMFSESEWKKTEEKFRSLSFTKQEVRFFNRFYFSGAYEVVPDAQGRVLLPSLLKEFARIKREIVIVGVSDRIEIWDKDLWREFYEENRERLEKMAEDIF
ncbi:MAG: division/cell wall cluster transcriptional repressor MraZ [Candidatus Omnitrophica bacterium]|nr:division/cell wall cluster transcriptional repressor MraZ [Candidatus Omnitrophota bacterium]